MVILCLYTFTEVKRREETTSTLQIILVELREFSKDVFLFVLREPHTTVCHCHAEHAHGIASKLIKYFVCDCTLSRLVYILDSAHLILDSGGVSLFQQRT